jgi:hypothetical protein
MNKYGTTNPVLIEARINHDPYDEFAWVQDWRFAIAEYLTHYRGTDVDGFRCSHDVPDSTTLAEESLEESFAFASLWGMNASTEELTYAMRVLDRYRGWLRVAGRDY